MSILMSCGVCCMCLSVWAILQLFLMGVFYKMESVVLIEDVHALHGEYDTYEDYIKKTKENYNTTAINCWICAGIYIITLLISLKCIHKAKKSEKIIAKKLEDDEFSCLPKPPVVPKKLIKKMKEDEAKRSRTPSPVSPDKKKTKPLAKEVSVDQPITKLEES